MRAVQTSRRAGFTLVEIMIVVAIIGVLSAIAVPNFVKARTTAQADTCIANLRQIDSAVQQWALENNAGASTSVTPDDIKDYIGHTPSGVIINTTGGYARNELNCPAGGFYTITNVKSKPTCSLYRDGHVLAN